MLFLYTTFCILSFLFFFLIIPRSPISTLFPYTTLFRSRARDQALLSDDRHRLRPVTGAGRKAARRFAEAPADRLRSEEHTSELQSRQYLVCRLLLEKKKRLTNLVWKSS